MGKPGISLRPARLHFHAPAIEEHNRDVDAFCARIDHPLAQTREIRRIDLIQTEVRRSVGADAWSSAHVQSGGEPVVVRNLGAAFRLFPYPKPSEVLIVALKKIQ